MLVNTIIRRTAKRKIGIAGTRPVKIANMIQKEQSYFRFKY